MSKPCRCLLDTTQPDLKAIVQDYLSTLLPEDRTEEPVPENGTSTAPGFLINGILHRKEIFPCH